MVTLNPAPRTEFDAIIAEVARWVARDADPVRTLTNVACLIGNQFRCDACSIYLQDPAGGDLLLAGTVGLRQECVGKISMRPDEGLTGLVAQTRRPLVVTSCASSHPRFRYFPDAGEDLYESFLGTPIIQDQQLVGVLVLQTFEEAAFSTTDLERMSAAGRLLGPHIATMLDDALTQLNSGAADL